MALKTNFGGSYFKPKEHLDAAAVLIEPFAQEERVSKNFGTTDTYVTADIVVFPTNESLLTGTPEPQKFPNAIIGGGVVARDMARSIGDQCFGRFVQKPNPKGSAPMTVFDGIGDPALIEGIEKYLAERSNNVPDFLKS